MVIFFLAFFPQFIHPAQGPQATQILILGAVFWIIGAIWDLAFACALRDDRPTAPGSDPLPT